MTKVNDLTVDIPKLRSLYTKNDAARVLLDHFASRQRNMTETTVDRLHQLLLNDGHPLSRANIISVLRELEDLRCGSFVAGRRGKPSRFEWSAGLVSLGQAASGETQEVEKVSKGDVSEEELDTMLSHSFQLRPNLKVAFELPGDLSEKEAQRLAEFLRTLPFERNLGAS